MVEKKSCYSEVGKIQLEEEGLGYDYVFKRLPQIR